MKRTENILKIMAKVSTENPVIQEFIGELKQVAIEENWTVEKWEQMKIDFLTTMFYKLAIEHEDIRHMLMADIYEELRA